MAVNPAGGVRFFIGAIQNIKAPILTDFTTDTTYVEVGEIETLGNFGDKASAISFTALADSRTRKFKGARDAGSMTVTTGDDPNDVGQIAMEAAEATPFNYNCYVQLNDQITSGGNPSKHYFKGMVGSRETAVGAVSAIVKRNFEVWVNSAIVDTVAT